MIDRIELLDIRFDAVVGILDSEQRQTQPLYAGIVLDLPLETAARTGELHHSINYAAVQAWFLTLAQQGRWRLIESLSMATCRLLLSPPAACEHRAQIEAVEVFLRKPTILDRATPGVRVRRERSWLQLESQAAGPGVTVQTLEATPVQGAWRVLLEPGAAWSVPATWSLHVLGGSGAADGQTLGYDARVARGPRVRVIAGDAGLALLAVGAPA